jgi:hypothetical protein
MRVFLLAFLLVASQPLLLVTGLVAKWLVQCRGGDCAGTMHAASPFGSSRDVFLAALVLTAPHVLAVLIAGLAWLLAAAKPLPRLRQRLTLPPLSEVSASPRRLGRIAR